MYDPDTAALIRLAPQLDGLDVGNLPEILSRAFAEIAAARVRLRTGTVGEDDLPKIVDFARRLALTNEALVSLAPGREDRAAAAFVAATAHQLSFSASRIGDAAPHETRLDPQRISSDIAAMLLFLVAEATADASEVADRIALPAETSIERSLIAALRALASGQPQAIIETPQISRARIRHDTQADTATSALYYTLLRGVRALAERLIRAEADTDDPVALFEQVRSLSVAESDVSDGLDGTGPLGAFAGPFHLASLLIAVGNDLTGGAVISLPPPTGIDPDRWRASMMQIAESRPYLWRNHRAAIEEGYLEPGCSAVVGFPTGAGKSTLSELKINAKLLAGKTVVFLAPTHALIDQTTTSLRGAFPTARVQRERADEFGFVTGGEDLPDILVMTPEACLMLMSFEPSVLGEVGLLIFDECHLLHPNRQGQDRRAVDAMLSVLNFARLAPEADMLLMSAMMKNTQEIAAWLETLTGRPALALSLAWKPTRQLRGCVVYENDVIKAHESALNAAFASKTTVGVPKAVKDTLKARPYGFFSLHQTWASNFRSDYAFLPFLDDEIQFATNNYWKLTPNAGVVASSLAASAAKAGIKTLVFSQTIPNANSVANKAAEQLGGRAIELTDAEKQRLENAADEMGGMSHLYLKTDEGTLTTATAVHHGLLLAEERRLCESLYKRRDGVEVLAATSTLSQGMNLPSELVIIAEDSRFDEANNKKDVLEAQELLNAAGRAGRAGKNASGIVVVIPGKVVGLDDTAHTIGRRWTKLKEVFGQSDQCLDIDDPLTALLDRVHAQAEGLGDLERYFLVRLAGHGGDESQDSGARLSQKISSTFAAFRAKQRNDEAWLETRIEAAIQFLGAQADLSEDEEFELQISSTTGVPLDVVSELHSGLMAAPPGKDATVIAWRDWMVDWLRAHPDAMMRVLRSDSLERLFGTPYKQIETKSARAVFAMPYLANLLQGWMAGESLNQLELTLGTAPDRLKTCDGARKFVVLTIPDLSYFFSLPSLLYQRSGGDSSEASEVPPALAQLGVCARLGLDSHEKAALNYQMREARLARRGIHREFERMAPYLKPAPSDETWPQTLDRVESASMDELNNRD